MQLRGRAPIYFDTKETRAVILLAFVIAFIITFDMWGENEFDAVIGLTNLLLAFIGMLFAVFLHELGHKLAASYQGYDVRIQSWGVGLIVSLFISAYSFGRLPLITPNLLSMDARPDLRLARHRKYDNPKEEAVIAAGGILGSIVVASMFLVFAGWFGGLFDVLLFGVIMHAVYSLIPFELLTFVKLRFSNKVDSITPGDGLYIWNYNSLAYIFILSFVVIFGGFALIRGTAMTVLSLLLAGSFAFVYKKWMA